MWISLWCGMASVALFAQAPPTEGRVVPSVFFGMHVTGNLERDWPTVPIGALGKRNATAWRYLQESPK